MDTDENNERTTPLGSAKRSAPPVAAENERKGAQAVRIAVRRA